MQKQLISGVPETLHNVADTELGFDGRQEAWKEGPEHANGL